MRAWRGNGIGVAVTVGDGVAVGVVVGATSRVAATSSSNSMVAVGSTVGVDVGDKMAGTATRGCVATNEGAGSTVGSGVIPISRIGSTKGICASRTRYSPGKAPTTLGTATNPPISRIRARTVNGTIYIARLLMI